jgi:hypothetical protein
MPAPSLGRETPHGEPPRSPAVSGGYALARSLARWWLANSVGKIRLLRGQAIPASGPALLVVNGSPSFAQAAAVAAALDRPVRCVLPEEECRSFGRRWLAARLGMILYGDDPSSAVQAAGAARGALEGGEVLAVFAAPEVARSEALSPSCVAVAKLVVEAESNRSGGAGAVLVPLHVLSAFGSAPVDEVLVTAGEPLVARSFLGGASSDASTRTLAGELENRLSDNPYRLPERDVQFFLADLEKVLRADLEEEFAARPNWKQKTEGFELSRFIAECAEQLNVLDPPRLIGLRIRLEDYREQLRQWSLHQAEVEAAGDWLKSSAWRTLYWLETILGFPVALYGFLNHLVPLALLVPRGPLRRLAEKDPGHAWLLRALVVLACYIVQVAFCSHWWGRAAAGYYTLTLPASGAFLWHYSRLARTRVRLLSLSRTLPRRAAKLRQLRKQVIEQLNQARDEYAEASLAGRSSA